MRRVLPRSPFARCASAFTLIALLAAPESARSDDQNTTTPIKHLIVIIGENRSFDHLFATYVPKPGQTVLNLLSEGIVNSDGSPGPNFSHASQSQARVTSRYEPAPSLKTSYANLPPLMTGSAPKAASDKDGPPFQSLSVASELDAAGLLPADLHLLLTGATGLPARSIDTRLPNVTSLKNGPYPLTPHIAYDAYASSPPPRQSSQSCGERR